MNGGRNSCRGQFISLELVALVASRLRADRGRNVTLALPPVALAPSLAYSVDVSPLGMSPLPDAAHIEMVREFLPDGALFRKLSPI